jgi:hypothetical protein
LEEVEKEEKMLESQSEHITKVMSQLKKGVPMIFERIGCRNEKYMKSLLGNEEINDGNILMHMKVIEQRTNEII